MKSSTFKRVVTCELVISKLTLGILIFLLILMAFLKELFQKIFPPSHKEFIVQDTNENSNTPVNAVDVSIVPLEITTEFNKVESNNEHSVRQNVTSTSHAISTDLSSVLDGENIFHDTVSNKTLYRLTAVAPIENNTINNIGEYLKVVEVMDDVMTKDTKGTAVTTHINDNTSPNQSNTCNEPQEIKDSYDIISNDLIFSNDKIFETEVSELINVKDDKTLQSDGNSSEEPQEIQDAINVIGENTEILNDHTSSTVECTGKNVIDQETMNNLREFKNTLYTFNSNLIKEDSEREIINLDEFNDIFNELETVNNDLRSHDSSDSESTKSTENAIKEFNENDLVSCVPENIDIISISASNEDVNVKHTISMNSEDKETQISDNDGYNSSDFEFISESEAHMDGLIINFNRENYNQDINSKISGHVKQENKVYEMKAEASDPGEGPSESKRPKHLFEDRGYRNVHRIPDGDHYLGLFQGIYNPLMPACEIYFLENKSVRTSAMNVQYDGIGFDKQLALKGHQPNSSEEEYEDEARECAKRILNTYPGENRKRRRRR